MDGRLAEASYEEAKDAERDEGEEVIGLQCLGCDYRLWSHVRLNVPTEIKCFRVGCGARTQVSLHCKHMPWTVEDATDRRMNRCQEAN